MKFLFGRTNRIILFGIFFYIAVTIIFFWPSIFSNKIPLPTDLLFDYLLDQPKEGANPLIRDSLVQLFPYSDFIYKSYKAGEIPLWNPYIFNGLNFEGTGQANIYLPLNLLIPLFPSSLVFFKFKIILFFFLAGFNLFLYLRSKRYPFLLCFLGGLIWQLSGPLVGWMSWATIVGVIVWLPLILLSFEQYFKKQEAKWLILLTIFNFFSLTSGHLQFYFYVLSFSCGYLLYLIIKSYKTIKIKEKLTLIFFLFLNFLIVLYLILPFLQNLKLSHRLNIVDTSHLSYQNIFQLVIPNFWGNHLNYHGTLNYLESLAYIGLMPILVSILGILMVKLKSLKRNIFWLSALALLIFYNFFPFASYPLEKLFPFFKNFPPFRSIFLIIFILIIFAIQTLSNFRKKAYKEKIKDKFKYFSTIILTGCLYAIISLIIKNNKLNLEWNFFWYQQIFHFVFCIGLVLLLLFLFLKNKLKFNTLLIAFIILVFFDQYIILGKFTPQQEIAPIFNPPAYVKFLQEQKIKKPLIYSELTSTNLYSLYDIRSIFGYDTSYPENYYQLIKQNGKIISHRNALNAKITNYKFLEKMEVKFIVTKREINGLRKVFENDKVKIYKLTDRHANFRY